MTTILVDHHTFEDIQKETDMPHTPGPWIYDERVGCVAVYSGTEKQNCLAGITDWAIYFAHGKQILDEEGKYVEWTVPAEKIAIARLISAAPDLLAALKVIASGAGAFDRDPLKHAENCISEMKATAKAAIEKAEKGES